MAAALVPSELGGGTSSVELEDVAECESEKKSLNLSAGAVKLRSWLNKSLRIQMFDGRVLIGVFLCTDRDANVILGSCTEYLTTDNSDIAGVEEPRMLGLVMVPGKHIFSVSIDQNHNMGTDLGTPLNKDVSPEEVT